MMEFTGEVVGEYWRNDGRWYVLADGTRHLHVRLNDGFLLEIGDVRSVNGTVSFGAGAWRMRRAWVIHQPRVLNAARERVRRCSILRDGRRTLSRVRRIALVTTWRSKALDDVRCVLRGTEIEIEHVCLSSFNVDEMVRALRYAATADVDAILLVSGGCSRPKLHVFNDLELADAVGSVQRQVPVLVGIGHASDHTFLDKIAHTTPTPTAAAFSLLNDRERRTLPW